MGACSAFGCSNRTLTKSRGESKYTKPGLSFHRFPTKPKLKAAWLRALRRVKFVPSPCARVCGEHFTEDCYYYTAQGKKLLKPGAIPSIFPGFPAHLQKKTTPRKPPKERVFIPGKSQSVTTSKTSPAPATIDESRFKQDPKNLFVAYRNSLTSARINPVTENHEKLSYPSMNSCLESSEESNQNHEDPQQTEFDPSDYIYPVNMEICGPENGVEAVDNFPVILISPSPDENSSEILTPLHEDSDSSPRSSSVKKIVDRTTAENSISPSPIEDSLKIESSSRKDSCRKSSLIVQNPVRGFVVTDVHEIKSDFEGSKPCSNCRLYNEANILLGNELEGKEQTICYLQEEIIRLKKELASFRSKTVNVCILNPHRNSIVS